MLASEFLEARPVYVIQVLPKREDKYLFEGRIWIDAEDFAVVRVEGKPAKNPSFWTRSVHFDCSCSANPATFGSPSRQKA